MMPAIRYASEIETVAPDEAESIADIGETLRAIQEITAKDYGRGVRALHAKGHAIYHGTVTIVEGLSPELGQGLFATHGAYDALIRFSTNPADLLDDSVSVPRGLAIKVLDVDGDRLEGSDADRTQDFVLVNAPNFAAATPKAFVSKLKLLAATTDRGEVLKKVLSSALQLVEATLETVGAGSDGLKAIGGARQNHPLGDTYYSQTPFRYGNYVVKFAVVPTSAALLEVSGTKVHTHNRPDALREVIGEVIAEQGGEWDLRVQFCTDLSTMKIEDAASVWSEDESPFQTVARITVAPQSGWQHGISDDQENMLSFSPWHGLAAHRPLGGINRARKPTYEGSVAFRASHNGCPIHEPRDLAEITA